jgi:TonB family protein
LDDASLKWAMTLKFDASKTKQFEDGQPAITFPINFALTSPRDEPTATTDAPQVVVHIEPHSDPRHPLRIGEEFYPDEAKRRHEEGDVTVLATIRADGTVEHLVVQSSSGFPLLDQAALNAIRKSRFLPATDDGIPVRATVPISVTWRLTR